MTVIEVPKPFFTQILIDLSEGDDEFVLEQCDFFGLTRPSEEGMKIERQLSDLRLQTVAPYTPIIEMVAAIAAKISVCSTLDESDGEDPSLADEEIADLAEAMKTTITAAFGAVAQHELQRGRNCHKTSG